jgi:hypothetical protein
MLLLLTDPTQCLYKIAVTLLTIITRKEKKLQQILEKIKAKIFLPKKNIRLFLSHLNKILVDLLKQALSDDITVL